MKALAQIVLLIVVVPLLIALAAVIVPVDIVLKRLLLRRGLLGSGSWGVGLSLNRPYDWFKPVSYAHAHPRGDFFWRPGSGNYVFRRRR